MEGMYNDKTLADTHMHMHFGTDKQKGTYTWENCAHNRNLHNMFILTLYNDTDNTQLQMYGTTQIHVYWDG